MFLWQRNGNTANKVCFFSDLQTVGLAFFWPLFSIVWLLLKFHLATLRASKDMQKQQMQILKLHESNVSTNWNTHEKLKRRKTCQPSTWIYHLETSNKIAKTSHQQSVQARSQVLRFGGKILRGKTFVFIICFNKKFSGHNKITGNETIWDGITLCAECPPCGYGPESVRKNIFWEAWLPYCC